MSHVPVEWFELTRFATLVSEILTAIILCTVDARLTTLFGSQKIMQMQINFVLFEEGFVLK